MKDVDRWLCWVRRPASTKTGEPIYNSDGTRKIDKVPIHGEHRHGISGADPSNGVPFEVAVATYLKHRNDRGATNVAGIGFFLGDGWSGGDLDKVLTPTRTVKPECNWADHALNRLDSYSEVSPSGTGVKIILHANEDDILAHEDFADVTVDHNRRYMPGGSQVEFYLERRYFTITGDHLDGTPIEVEDRGPEAGAWYYDTFADLVAQDRHRLATAARHRTTPTSTAPTDHDRILAVAFAAKNGDTIRRLWEGHSLKGSDSEDDAALVSYLAFYTGPDADLLESLMYKSGRVRDKWDKARKGHGTWLQMTIAKYLDHEEYYDWSAWERDQERQRQEQREVALEGVIGRVTAQDAPGGDDDGEYDPSDYAASYEPQKPKPSGRRGYRPSEIRDFDDPKWVVQDHIVENSFVGIFGASGSFKSFFALDLAFSVATGTPFLGKFRVMQGPVLYIYAEGKGGMRRRLRAWEKARGITLPEDMVCVVPHAFHLSGDGETEVNELIKIAQEILGTMPTIIVIDTLNRNFGSGDENATKDMKGFVDMVDLIRHETAGSVIPIHHTGRDVSRKERGSSAFRASADTLIEVVRKDKTLKATIKCDKQKDADQFPDYEIVAERVELPDGDSLVLDYGGIIAEEGDKEDPTPTSGLSKTGKADQKRLMIFSRHASDARSAKDAAMAWGTRVDYAKTLLKDLHARELLEVTEDPSTKAKCYYLSTRGVFLLETN